MATEKSINGFYIDLLNIIKNSKAVVYRYFDEEYTYQELYSLMLKINTVLSEYRNGQIVLYASKNFSAYATIFSITLSNNIWIPLSPENPDARNLEILKQTNPALAICEGKLSDEVSSYLEDNNVDIISLEEISSRSDEKEFKTGIFRKDDTAYIMFTSGSTGVPKGVPMTHENYINFVNNVLEILPFGENEVFSDFHDFAFDISIFYLFTCPFVQGAFSPIKEERDKIIPINHILKNKVTVWSSVPSVLSRIKAFKPNEKVNTSIRIMFLCGEPLRLDVLNYCLKNMDITNVYNFYGLTETGVENFYHKCVASDLEEFADYGIAPIGKPLPGNYVKITEEKELYIGGCQVTPGYLGNKSPEKFESVSNIRWCKTGDIVENPSDVYICKGRIDSQVKLSGYRVELMDIEAHLLQQEHVEEAVCFVDEIKGGKLLVAALKVKKEIDIDSLRNKLKKRLPIYMIPKNIFYLDQLPLNKNGKIDRKQVRLTCKNICI
jgi:D-alanine--poly(phosphoribitol) ligase subunit 1